MEYATSKTTSHRPGASYTTSDSGSGVPRTTTVEPTVVQPLSASTRYVFSTTDTKRSGTARKIAQYCVVEDVSLPSAAHLATGDADTYTGVVDERCHLRASDHVEIEVDEFRCL